MHNPPTFTALESLESRLLLDAVADLAISNLHVTGPFYAGAAITVEYDITNNGTADVTDPWSDTVYESKTTKPNVNTDMQQQVSDNANGTVAALGGTIHVSTQLTLMAILTGKRYIIVQVNPDQNITEDNFTNNNANVAITVVAPPMCALEPATLTPVGASAVGNAITLNYHVVNNSPNPTVNYDFDQIYYSTDNKLDAKDITLYRAIHSPSDPAVAGGGAYDGGTPLTVRSLDMLGPGYLIIKVTGINQGKNANNVKIVPINVEGTLFTSLTSGQLMLHSQALPLTIKNYSVNAGNTLNAWVDNYQVPTLGGGGANPGTVTLISNLSLPQGASQTPVALDTSSLPDGMYDLVFQWTQGANAVYTRTMRVMVVDSVTHVQHTLGKAVGGDGFQIYSMDVGTIGQTLIFHVATNFVDIGPAGHGTDGDFMLRVGKSNPQVFGLAVDDRTTDDPNKSVTAGNLYTSAVFNKGSIVPKYYSQINGYAQEQVGRSYSAKLVGEGGDPWARDIYGGVQLAALGAGAAQGMTASWTMWCGNDEIEITWPPKPPITVSNGQAFLPVLPKPVVTALTAPGDKNPDVKIVGKYTAGPPHVIAITAKVTATATDPVVAVIFVLADGTRFVDTNPAGGWSVSVDVGNPIYNGQLLVTAVTKAGVASDVFNGQIQIG